MTILETLCEAHGQNGGTIHQFERLYRFPFLHPNVSDVTVERTKHGTFFRVHMANDDRTEFRSCCVCPLAEAERETFINNLQCDLGMISDWSPTA